MSEADVLDVAEQVLEILVYLHGHSPPVVHRDVKPANLIELPSHGRIMLVDFGLARTIESSAAQTMVGTIGYAPIEQLQGRAEVRSDLYGLGATMHHLLAGALPPALCLPSLKQVRPDAHPAMVELVDKAVQTNPGDRFSDASSMLLAVREVRTQLPVRPEADPEPEPVKDGSPERILIVDDDSLVRNFVQRVLEREMYQVLVAHDGQEALQLALKTRPDLIVSDVQMPGMDGLALCRKLQSHRVTRHIPVLFLTGKTEVADETLGLEAGAEDYISKPIVPERLVARVQAALRRRMGREG
jgi:CheY-like chemotaxis protein